jgi:hypothetical protein
MREREKDAAMSDDGSARLTPDDLQALVCILDTLIPRSADGRLPGAGELGIASEIESMLSPQGELWQSIVAGLAAFRSRVGDDGLEGFAASSIADRSQLLNDLAEAQPALVPTLVFNTYAAYYRHPKVITILGIEAWPPHPKGYEMAPMSPERLDHMRSRPPLYRVC